MTTMRVIGSVLVTISLSTVPLGARAQIPVIDAGALIQLVTQVNTLEQQLNTARQDLSQAEQQYQSTVGARGMEQLLGGTNRNYLPTDWAQLQAAMQGSGPGFALGADIGTNINSNAVLSAQQMAALAPPEQDAVQAGRRGAALVQAISQEALARTSERFAALQTLINAISSASDQKGILDLLARITAEQSMLQNEQTKLNVLSQAAAGDELARQQRVRERAVTDIGSLRSLPAMGL
jgi:type IV secretion system protein VirB5